MSKHEPYGNVKMKGKKTKLLPCGCCVARNKECMVKAGDIHEGTGYSESTKEKYEEFVVRRNSK